MQKADALIRTKLRLPYTRPGLVARPRLQEQVAQGLCGPLTLVAAPAGFGKTTLVASCVANNGMPAAWLSLDKSDNQPGRFLTYLVASLQAADNRIGNEAAQLMAGIQQAQPDAVLTSLINDLDSTNSDIVLVLDDYQQISSQAVHDEVAFLLNHQPSTFHLVVTTRSDPPLPLARLRARGQTVELRATDLCFNKDEAAQFLNDVMHLRLDDRLVTALEERTEGWIAGLQMAALSMRDRKDILGFIEGFSGTNRYILDYLLEEVLANQPPEIQHFLLSTSILERLTAPLCDAILACGEATAAGSQTGERSSLRQCAPILEYLERENLFLVSLDDEQVWFRYHHLFSDLLKARLHQTRPELVPNLHMRASAWLAQNGFIPEAIQHLLAAKEIEQAADLIEQYGAAGLAESDVSVLLMADSLPPEMLIARPRIGIYKAWMLIIQGHIEKVLPLLNDLAQLPEGAERDPGREWIQIIARLALAFLYPPPLPGALPLPDVKVLDGIPPGEPVMQDAANILYGMALGRRGETEQAVQFSLERIQKEKSRSAHWTTSHGGQLIHTLVPFLTTMYLFQGRLHEAASLCQEFLEPIKEKGLRLSTAGNLDVVLGDVMYQWNCLEEAEQHIREGLQANEPWGNIMTDAFGQLALQNVLLAKGDYAGAMQVVGRLEGRLQGLSQPIEFAEPCRTMRVLVQLASGDLQSAALWAEQVRFRDDFQQHPEYYWLTLAHISLAQGRYAEAEKLAVEASSTPGYGNFTARQIEIKLLQAAALAGQQRSAEAFETTGACLALAEPEGYIRTFLNMGELARELLAAYLRADGKENRAFAQKVLRAFSQTRAAGAPTIQPNGLVEQLSERELEVLQLMAEGKTNQEIAQQVVVARGTIKAHAASIYRKLDVDNRTEAVARARQLAILP